MKKIICLLSLFLLLNASLVNAEIRKGTDSFTNGISIRSYIEVSGIIDRIRLEKTMYDDISNYEMFIGHVTGKGSLLKDNAIEIKIDNYSVLELNKYKYTTNQMIDNPYLFNASIRAELSNELVEKIKFAERIALRYETNIGNFVYVLPDEVLNEWKQVIEMEK